MQKLFLLINYCGRGDFSYVAELAAVQYANIPLLIVFLVLQMVHAKSWCIAAAGAEANN